MEDRNSSYAPTPPSRSNEKPYSEKSPFSWNYFSPRRAGEPSPKKNRQGKRPNMSEIVYGAPKSRTFRDFQVLPHLPLPPNVADKKVPWFWFPYKVRPVSPLFLRGLLCTLLYMLLLLLSTVLFPLIRWIPALVILILTAICLPIAYVVHIMEFNYKLRDAIAFSAGKSVQAKAHFSSGILKVAADATYFEYNIFPGGKIVVLNDGTQEFWNSNPTLEFSEALNESLGFSGFISVTRSHTNTISDISRDSNSDSTIIPMTDMAEKTKRRVGESVDMALEERVNMFSR